MQDIDLFEEIGNFVFTSKYARYDNKHKRRESWRQSIKRVERMHLKKYAFLPEEDIKEIIWAFDQVREKNVVPSMRSMQFGGKPIEIHNTRIFNCAVRHIDSIRSFSEIMFLLMCGVGVGIGLMPKYLNRLPDLVDKNDRTGTIVTYVVEDSIEGWSDAIEALLSCYFKNNAYTGRKIVFDFSRIRPKGSPIKTGGGKAPGHKGLKQSLLKIKGLLDLIIENRSQNRLLSINAYDIIMHMSDAVLSGGIRRAAVMAIFHPDDKLMLNSKTNFDVTRKIGFECIENKKGEKEWEGRVQIDDTYGGVRGHKYDVILSDYEYKEMLCKHGTINWHHIEPQRARSNNSALLLRNKLTENYLKDAVEKIKQYGEPGFILADHEDFLVNPCCEVGFIPVTDDGICGVQFCNLTSINGGHADTIEKFMDAAKAATIIGTLQAGYNKFNYLSNTAEQLTQEESLLGVSITGFMDNPDILLNPEIQARVAKYTKEINKKWAEKIGINQASRITLVKPEGSTSLVLGTASGIHPHHAKKYFRRIQCNKEDNVYKFLKQHNKHATEPSIWSATNSDDILTFPLEVSHENAIVKSDLDAIKHLKYILSTQKNWVLNGETENNKKNIHHNVSCFSGDTKFITDKGLVRFDSFKHNDNVKILNRYGKFVDASVKLYGEQEIYEIELTSNKKKIKIKTTKDHLWPVTNAQQRYRGYKEKILKTTDILNKQLNLIMPRKIKTINKQALLHGIVFGDGTYHKGTDKCNIFLCDDSIHMYKLFEECGYSGIDRSDINQYRIYGLPNNWKQLPDTIDPEYLFSFIAGWFASDGSVSKQGDRYSISSINIDNLEWIQKYAPIAGLATSTNITKITTGKDGYIPFKTAYILGFIKDSLCSEFFVHNKKLKRYNDSNKKQSSKRWRVSKIIPTNKTELVYCIEEPDNHEFVLEGNILTHNCTIIVDENEWDSVIKFIFENKDYFTGISFIPKTGDKLYKQAPNEAVVTEEDQKIFDELINNWQRVDYLKLEENEDGTMMQKEVACAGGSCEIITI